MAADRYEQLHVETRSEWRAWLSEHHASVTGIWQVSWKKATDRPNVGYDGSVEEALCFGWVDSLPRKLADERSMLLFTPRKRGSRWSRPNKERVERLIAAGQMTAAGLAVIDEAKASEPGPRSTTSRTSWFPRTSRPPSTSIRERSTTGRASPGR